MKKPYISVRLYLIGGRWINHPTKDFTSMPCILSKLGGRGQNRTADTRIFNPLLYRLSYPASVQNTHYDLQVAHYSKLKHLWAHTRQLNYC